MNIWRVPAARNGRAHDEVPIQVAASTSIDTSPQFSPDGSRIAFVSLRSGHAEIWLARSDGAEAVQVTTFGGPLLGSPRWSPQGDAIAFDSTKPGTFNVYVMRLADGRVHAVTNDRWANVRPSWSGDGRWIYFGSTRSGVNQVWKVASAGGDPVQVTKNGGFEAFESPDGRHVYYALANGVAGIWQVPVTGGEERQLLPIGTLSTFAVSARGIFVLQRSAKSPTIALLRRGDTAARPRRVPARRHAPGTVESRRGGQPRWRIGALRDLRPVEQRHPHARRDLVKQLLAGAHRPTPRRPQDRLRSTRWDTSSATSATRCGSSGAPASSPSRRC